MRWWGTSAEGGGWWGEMGSLLGSGLGGGRGFHGGLGFDIYIGGRIGALMLIAVSRKARQRDADWRKVTRAT